jgi:2-oxoglutarate dehydrogenase E1 component
LQLCAEDNMQVMNLTTPAQYFHVFRRQMWQSFRKPLIIMTPKSLLRHKRCVSRLEDLSESSFHFVLDDPAAPKNVENLLICSGKVYYDLVEERERRGDDRTAIVRIEQLYPRPTEAAREVLGRYEKARSVRWVQEESRNRGGWSFVHEWLSDLIDRPRIEYVGRPASASPASGSHQEHKAQLEEFLEQAFKREQ